MRLSLAIIAKHNALGFRRLVLDAIPFVDDIVVVCDEGSEYGIEGFMPSHVRYFHRALGNNFSEQRNFASERCDGDWIINLDTDETLTARLWCCIRDIIEVLGEGNDVIEIPRTSYMSGEDGIVSYNASWPDWQPKVVRTRVKWEHPVHEWPVTNNSVRMNVSHTFSMCIVHTKTRQQQCINSAKYASIQENSNPD